MAAAETVTSPVADPVAAAARENPRLVGVLTPDSLQQLLPQGRDKASFESLARLLLRRKVWNVRGKVKDLGCYSAARTEEVLASHTLPPELAAECGLEPAAGQTWLDALRHLRRACSEASAAELWHRVEEHPMTRYVHAQCQHCGQHIPDQYPAPEDPNLTEEPPTESERPFVRAGWFRGPRDAVVFVYRCPACAETSRWFRSSAPEVTLNPNRWGRLCGEQEDLKLWLAKYLGVPLRMCIPLDWDHVWTELFDGERWRPLDPNCVNFARRLHEGIGAWTGVLAVGTSLLGDAAADSQDATEAYLSQHPQPTAEEEACWRRMVAEARADGAGAATQSRTLCGHVLLQAGFDADRVTAELKLAHADFESGRAWFDL